MIFHVKINSALPVKEPGINMNQSDLPAVGAAQGYCQWSLKNVGNFHQSRELRMHCNWGTPNLFLDQPVTPSNVSWLKTVSHTALTVLQPSSEDCETVYEITHIDNQTDAVPLTSQYIIDVMSVDIINTESAKRFCGILVAILNDIIRSKRSFCISDGQQNFVENICSFVVIIVPADGLEF